MNEPIDKEQCLNIADQCAATASNDITALILVVLEVETNETWFDHWLDTSCPRWLRNFFVVKKKKITKSENVDFDVLYPNFHPAHGKDKEYVWFGGQNDE